MARSGGASRDWLLAIRFPDAELRDAAAAALASGIGALRERPAVSVRSIESVDQAGAPSIALQIRTRTEVSAAEATVTATDILHHHASALDMSAVAIRVTGQPRSD